LTERFSGKYLKKLLGHGTDIEDTLKRLDILTQQEAQMCAAQVLKATHTVDETGQVRGVADIALSVDNRVASVVERVAGVDEHVAGVNERVVGVDHRVAGIGDQIQGVDDKVTAVMDGA
jgi:hypothetical protein